MTKNNLITSKVLAKDLNSTPVNKTFSTGSNYRIDQVKSFIKFKVKFYFNSKIKARGYFRS